MPPLTVLSYHDLIVLLFLLYFAQLANELTCFDLTIVSPSVQYVRILSFTLTVVDIAVVFLVGLFGLVVATIRCRRPTLICLLED